MHVNIIHNNEYYNITAIYGSRIMFIDKLQLTVQNINNSHNTILIGDIVNINIDQSESYLNDTKNNYINTLLQQGF